MSLTMGGQDRMKGIGVTIRGDSTQLRQALKEAVQATRGFKEETDQALRSAGSGASQMQSHVAGAAKGVGTSLTGAGTSAKNFGTETRQSMREAAQATEDLDKRGSQSLNSFGGVLKRYLGPAALAGIGLQLGKVGLGFHDFMQKNELAFETMLGSAGAAKEFLADILDFAKQTPFGFPELTASAQKMVAFGVDAKDVVGILQTLGDATVGAGKGMADLDGVATVIGQISAKGRLQSEEILQLAERGIPALAVLANQANMTVGEFQDVVKTGTVDADTAITNLTEGLRDGTDGLAGTTAAYGGLMEKIKESGGLTATLDSTKSGFRNMAAALTESLIPSLVDLLNITQDVMGLVKGAANVFNMMPAPLRNAALAVTGLTIANKLLKLEVGTRSLAAWTGFTRAIDGSRTAMHRAGTGAAVTGGKLQVLSAGARAAGTSLATAGRSAIMAFGGPAGIALGALTLGVSAYTNRSAEAKAATDAWKSSLDQATGAMTQQTDELVAQELAVERSRGWIGSIFGAENSSLLEDAEDIGLSVDQITEAWKGSEGALAEVNGELKWYFDAVEANGGKTEGLFIEGRNVGAAGRFTRALETQTGIIAESSDTKSREIDVQDSLAESTRAVGAEYREAALGIASFDEEQQKAIDTAKETARKGYDSVFSTSSMDLNISSLDDLASAEDGVTQANRRVRDSEQSLADTRERKDVKVGDITRAEEAVTDARKNAKEATDSLNDVEARRDPVKQYKKQLEETKKAAETFYDDIMKLGDLGLNAESLMDIQAKGPEKAKDEIDAMLKDNSLIDATNQQGQFDETMGKKMGTLAGVLQASVAREGTLTGDEFTLAMGIAMEENSATSVSGLAEKLGEDQDEIRRVGGEFGLTFIEGFADFAKVDPMDIFGKQDKGGFFGNFDPMSVFGFGNAPMRPSYYSGGVIPGYTPGRDTMSINVGGGEAIMRPEWTQAMSPGYVHKMNSIARSSGVSGVQAAMKGFGGSFYNGGIAGGSSSPQIIEVPVTSRVENHGVTTFGDIYAADMADIKQAARQSRRGAFTGGRP